MGELPKKPFFLDEKIGENGGKRTEKIFSVGRLSKRGRRRAGEKKDEKYSRESALAINSVVKIAKNAVTYLTGERKNGMMVLWKI